MAETSIGVKKETVERLKCLAGGKPLCEYLEIISRGDVSRFGDVDDVKVALQAFRQVVLAKLENLEAELKQLEAIMFELNFNTFFKFDLLAKRKRLVREFARLDKQTYEHIRLLKGKVPLEEIPEMPEDALDHPEILFDGEGDE